MTQYHVESPAGHRGLDSLAASSQIGRQVVLQSYQALASTHTRTSAQASLR
jgi:hypothetical protein